MKNNNLNIDLRVAVVGGTGQVGYPLTEELLKLGAEVLVVSRKRHNGNKEKLNALKAKGAELQFCDAYDDVDNLIEIFEEIDVVVVTTQVNVDIVNNVETKILEAAEKAGVKRFVPCEFGLNTLGIEYGNGTLFDAKKSLQEKIFKTDMQWTMIFAGGIFDYFLPNLRMFEKVMTFGDVEVTFPTHHIRDISAISARAVIDERTVNKAVQIYGNVVTQKELVDLLKEKWPEYNFEYEHVSLEEIIYKKDHSDPNTISAKAGAESDQERFGINYSVYVMGKMASNDHSDVLLSTELYPDYIYKKPEEAISDYSFVFGDS